MGGSRELAALCPSHGDPPERHESRVACCDFERNPWPFSGGHVVGFFPGEKRWDC